MSKPSKARSKKEEVKDNEAWSKLLKILEKEKSTISGERNKRTPQSNKTPDKTPDKTKE